MSAMCPDCAVPLSAEEVGDVTLLACPACQAVAVERDAVLRLRGVDRASHPLLRSGEGEASPSGGVHEAHRACPRCKKTMASFFYRGGSVRAEQCADCDLLFFDQGELAQVLTEWEQGIARGEEAEGALLAYRAGGELDDWLNAESALGVFGIVSVLVAFHIWDEEWASLPVAAVLGAAFYFWQRRRLRRKKRRALRALRELEGDERMKAQAKRGAAGPSPEVDRCPWCGVLVKRGVARCHVCDSDIF